MEEVDTAILAALHKSSYQYVLLRVGSSCSLAKEVVPSDIDYVCVNASDSGVKHEENLIQMSASFSDVPHTVGFTPRWPDKDAEVPKIIQANLGNRYLCEFRFGPIIRDDTPDEKQIVHFAGPVSAGDFERFTKNFPVLSYMFCKYGKCLRGNKSAIHSDDASPTLTQFADLLMTNCQRGQNAITYRSLVVATQKALLLRAVWHKHVDPYQISRIAAKRCVGNERSLLLEASKNPERFILQETD